MTFYQLYKRLYPTQNIIVMSQYKGEVDIEYKGAAKDISISYYKAKIKRIMADSDGEIWIELK